MNYTDFKKEYQKAVSNNTTAQFLRNTYIEHLKESNDTAITNKLARFDNFIGPYNVIVLEELYCFFECSLDNPKIYYEFFSYIKENKNLGIDNIFTVTKSIQSYIDSFKDDSDIFDTIGLESDIPISITELEKKKIMPGVLKTAVAHNLLKFIGLKSELVFGRENNQKDTYIIIHSKSRENDLLYDLLNPIYYDNSNGISRERKYVALSKISKEEYKSLEKGGRYNFSYDVVNNLYNNKLSDYDEKRYYTMNNNIYNYSNQRSTSKK